VEFEVSLEKLMEIVEDAQDKRIFELYQVYEAVYEE
jgi:uncharacterized protein YjaG (DUF416 family)